MNLKLYHILGAAACGLLTAAAFTSLEAMFVAWISLIPLFFLLSGKKPGQASLLAGTAGLFFHGLLLHWLPSCLAPVAVSAAAWAVFGFVFSLIETRRPFPAFIAAPFLWAGLEFALTLVMSGRAWGALGLSQSRNLLFIQMAGITGVFGVSFILVLFQALFVGAIRTSIRMPFVVGMVLLVLVHLGGFLVLQKPTPTVDSFEAAAFQGEGIPASDAATGLRRFRGLVFGSPAGPDIAGPDLVRRLVGRGASFLTTHGEPEAKQTRAAASGHLTQAVFRAVENRRSVLRLDVGKGFGEIIDAFGRSAASVIPGDDLTFYTRHGDVFALFCLTISAGFLILSFLFMRRP
ncbi:MAG: hypothetical protein JW843_12535 [Candidatus Aminicenantes bacterium]|nr:hypothetical protein [Candidatus Aminicenantes bacterium]